MDQAGGVRDVETRTDVLDQRNGPLGLECALAAQQDTQVDAVDPLHRDVEEPLVFAGVEHRDDARMLEQRGDVALPQETLAEPGVGCERRVEHLQRHRPPVGIAREMDGPGCTLTQQRLDPVAGDVRARREQMRHASRSYSRPSSRASRAPAAPLRLAHSLARGGGKSPRALTLSQELPSGRSA